MSGNTLGRAVFREWHNAQPYSGRLLWEAYKAGFENALGHLSEELAADIRAEFNSELIRPKRSPEPPQKEKP